MGLLITAFFVLVAVFLVGIMASEHRWLRVVLGCVLLALAACSFYLGNHVLNHHSMEANASGVGLVMLVAWGVGGIAALASIAIFAWALRTED